MEAVVMQEFFFT